jgi:hypothetical protein
MSAERSLALVKLVKDHEMLSEVEVASVVAPLLDSLQALHATGRAHGNVSLATVTIRVVEPADGTIHLPDPGCCGEAAHRPCAGCQQTAEGPTPASDVWSVGLLALQLLLGRPCRDASHAPLVDPRTGELPMLPRGVTLECIDFLMDCLAPRPEDRASAAELRRHDFLGTIAPPSGPAAATADSLADSLADCLLISAAGKQQAPACRPCAVPSLKAKGRVCFTAPSHTARCALCRCQRECHHEQQQQARGEREQAGVSGGARALALGLTLAAADKAQHVSPKTSPCCSTSKSAAPTKRKAGASCLLDQPAATPKRKCSGLVKYLSPAILPMAGDLTNAPALVLEA